MTSDTSQSAAPSDGDRGRDSGGENLNPDIRRIIRQGRAQPTGTASAGGGNLRAVACFSLTGLLLLWSSFAPLEISAAAWIALLPLCQLIRIRVLPKRSYLIMWTCSLAVSLLQFQWMRLGHPAMWLALIALSLYVAFYFPLTIGLCRRLHRSGGPLWLVVPAVWTSLEYLRAHLFTGFAWYFLGHSQYSWISLIQVSDITGAYGVSFLIACCAGAAGAAVPPKLLTKFGLAASENEVLQESRRSVGVGQLTASGLFCAALVYGVVRGVPADARPAPDDPVIAAIQGNFTPEVKADDGQAARMLQVHELLMWRASQFRPDIIVWPETTYPIPDFIVDEEMSDDDIVESMPPEVRQYGSDYVHEQLRRWRSGATQERLETRSREVGCAVMYGMATHRLTNGGPVAYNSAAFVRPDLGFQGAYHKVHRVIFGEYVPLRSVFPWLAKLTPYGVGFGIEAGDGPSVFEYRGVRYAPVICFEDTVPHVVRNAVRTPAADGRLPDVVLNLTNDGWFRGSSELDQHLITSVFRAVEHRRPLIRAVNTGISAFIDSSGRIRTPDRFLILQNEDEPGLSGEFEDAPGLIDPQTGYRYRQMSSIMIGQIPLDGRSTLYTRFGDWFAILCSAGTGVWFAALAAAAIRDRRKLT